MARCVLLPDFKFRFFLENATRIRECFGMFFCWSSDSSCGDSSFVAFAGNWSSARHRTEIKVLAKAADSTSARTSAARINAVPPSRTSPDI